MEYLMQKVNILLNMVNERLIFTMAPVHFHKFDAELTGRKLNCYKI